MRQPHNRSDSELYDAIDESQLVIARAQRAQLRAIHEFDQRGLWREHGCFHMGHWLAGRLGITISEGIRRTDAAHALERLPLLSRALETGVLSLEKVEQLARFLTPETEADLIRWARRVTLRTVRDRATLEVRRPRKEASDAHEARFLRWYPLDAIGSIGLEGRLPADQGTLLTKMLERIAEGLPPSPEPDPDAEHIPNEETAREQRYADALMALVFDRCSDVPVPTVVLHTSVEALRGEQGSEIEGGPVVHPDIARRIACDARLRMVLDDANGVPVGIGYTSRDIPKYLRTEVLRRDRGCVFPGCGTRRYVDCHHVVFWPDGPTNLDNLVALCNFHHDLVHQGGWRIELDESQMAVWYRPDGGRYEPGLLIHRKRADANEEEPEISGSAKLALIAATFR